MSDAPSVKHIPLSETDKWWENKSKPEEDLEDKKVEVEDEDIKSLLTTIITKLDKIIEKL